MAGAVAPTGRPVTVEILIVSYNTRLLLADCLRSIDAYRPAPETAAVSVTVLDNASGDGSGDLVREQFPWVQLLRSDRNIGFAKANNRLAAQSTADYLLLLNSDTRLTVDLITPLLGALAGDPEAALAGPRMIFPDGRLQYSSERFPRVRYEAARAVGTTRLGRVRASGILREISRVRRTREVEARKSHRAEFLWATCWLLRRAEVASRGLFDEDFVTYDEDLDFCRQLADRGGTALYVARVELVHIGGASSTSETKRRMVRDARKRYYDRHGSLLQAVGYRLLIFAFSRLNR